MGLTKAVIYIEMEDRYDRIDNPNSGTSTLRIAGYADGGPDNLGLKVMNILREIAHMRKKEEIDKSISFFHEFGTHLNISQFSTINATEMDNLEPAFIYFIEASSDSIVLTCYRGSEESDWRKWPRATLMQIKTDDLYRKHFIIKKISYQDELDFVVPSARESLAARQ